MCSRHGETHGADSAQSLADAIAIVEGRGLSVVKVERCCTACYEPALLGDVYCKQHRLRAEEEDRL
jgi:hypothetical protein